MTPTIWAAESQNNEIGALLDELGIELVIAVGEGGGRISAASDAHPPLDPRRGGFDDVASLLQPGDAILVKASRAVGLEGIPASIEKRASAWSES